MNTHKIVRDMIGKNDSESQYNYKYQEQKNNTVTAPPEYFEMMNEPKKRKGQNMNAQLDAVLARIEQQRIK